jgi:multiple sugar transport system substrate-binding protein
MSCRGSGRLVLRRPSLGRHLLWLAVIALVASCGTADSGEFEIEASPYIKPVYETIARQFMSVRKGLAVEFSAGPREEDQMVQQILRTQLIGVKLPDVIFVSGNLVRILADRGLAVPLDRFIAAYPQWHGEFSPAVAAAGRIGSTTYGLGFGFSLPVILINSALARRAGADPHALPSRWADIVALAKKINSPASHTVGGFLEYDNGGSFSFLFLLGSYGGQMLTADERFAAFDDERGLAALEVLRGFGEAGQAHADMTRDQARQAFGAGAIGVFVTMSSMIPRLEAASGGRFEVLSVPLPLEATDGKVPTAGPVAVMLTRDPQRQRVAFDLMKFVCGSAGQQILTEGSGYVPANEVAIGSSAAIRAVLETRRNSHAYLDRLQHATGWYTPPGPNATQISDTVITSLQQVVTLKITPAMALKTLAAQVGSLLPTAQSMTESASVSAMIPHD